MNDKEYATWLKEEWRPFNDWKGKINMRIARLEVRTKLMLAKSAYLKAQAERRAWQGAATGRQGEIAARVTPDVPHEDGQGSKRRRRARVEQANTK